MINKNNDKKLIKLLKKGNPKAYKEAYFMYYDHLISVGSYFNFELLTPEDFVNDTFLKVYENRTLLKEEVSFEKQLFVICKNLILNHLQRENKVIRLEPSFLQEVEDEENPLKEIELQIEQLHRLIQQLPRQQQKIYSLHKLQNYSYKEIAEITQLSPKTIANHIYLAHQFILKKAE